MDGVGAWQCDALTALGVRHVFTGAGYNMSATSGPDTDATPVRRRNLCKLVGGDYHRLAVAMQTHGTHVHYIPATPPRRAIPIADCDATFTDQPRTPLLALSADCPLVVAAAPGHPAVGVAHCGWRGTVQGMPETLVRAMHGTIDVHPADLHVIVAPFAQTCCYEIQDDVAGQVADVTRFPDRHIHRRQDRLYLDLGTLIAEQLVGCGIDRDRIRLPRDCTICDRRFYSYRRLGRNTGHAGLMVCLAD